MFVAVPDVEQRGRASAADTRHHDDAEAESRREAAAVDDCSRRRRGGASGSRKWRVGSVPAPLVRTVVAGSDG